MSEQEEILRKEFGKLLSDDYCYLSHTFRVEGNLYSPTSVMLEGVIEGDLFSEGNVFVEEGATINGNVSGKNIVIYGTVKGSISAKEKLGLHKKASVEGDIIAKKCILEENVTLLGRIRIDSNLTIDTSFDYPEIKVNPPKVKSSEFKKFTKKAQKKKEESEDLMLPLYPVDGEKKEDDNADKPLVEKENTSTTENGKEKESEKSKVQEDKSNTDKKSRIDLLDSDHSLW